MGDRNKMFAQWAIFCLKNEPTKQQLSGSIKYSGHSMDKSVFKHH